MIGIIADSTCDIPESLIDQYGIIVIPQMVIWGEQQLRDRIDIRPEEFYQRLLTDPQRPHSSLPAVGDIQAALREAIRGGADQLIVLTVSSAMSGTYNLVNSTAQEMGIQVKMVDSRGPSMSLGWQVIEAARGRESGEGVDAIIERVRMVREKLAQYVAMDSLEYLQRGGRLGGAVRWAGTMLSIKPLVAINHQTGLVEPVALARTHLGLVGLLYSKFFEKIKGGQNLHIAVMHGNATAEAERLAEQIQAEHQPKELLVNMTGPVLGINTGPGALALCGYAEEHV